MKDLWGKWYNVVKADLDENGFYPGNKLSPANLGFDKSQVEYFHRFSTKWKSKTDKP